MKQSERTEQQAETDIKQTKEKTMEQKNKWNSNRGTRTQSNIKQQANTRKNKQTKEQTNKHRNP